MNFFKNNSKKIVAVICCVVLILMTVGCAMGSKEANAEEIKNSSLIKGSSFAVAEIGVGIYSPIVVYHKETKVMYAMGSADSKIMTLLVNPDGTPMLYEGD